MGPFLFKWRRVTHLLQSGGRGGGGARALIQGAPHGLGDFGQGISGLHDEQATVCLSFYRNHHYLAANLTRKR